MDIQNTNDFIEAIRAQRTEHADSAAKWFAAYMAEKSRADKLQAEVDELKVKRPKLVVE